MTNEGRHVLESAPSPGASNGRIRGQLTTDASREELERPGRTSSARFLRAFLRVCVFCPRDGAPTPGQRKITGTEKTKSTTIDTIQWSIVAVGLFVEEDDNWRVTEEQQESSSSAIFSRRAAGSRRGVAACLVNPLAP